MKKMGLLGGTFDPIHCGHIAMAQGVATALGLDGVLLMPTFVPPHKIKETLAEDAHRLAMCRLAAQDTPLLQVSELELQRGGASFTVDTLTALHRAYPDTRWYLITGADMFVTLRTWHRFEELARLAVLCTVPRAGVDVARLGAYAAELEAAGASCYVHPQGVAPLSSTDIRRRAAAGESLEGLCPPAVAAYIQQHGLYRQPGLMKRQSRDEQFVEIIRARLSEKRFHHSLCVAQEARRLAQRYGADPDKAYTAGLLHDIMKDTDAPAQRRMLAEFGISLDAVEAHSPTLWHARCGAAFLRHILGVEDEEILQAVRYHTTGRAAMSLLEQVLFVADFTSADRQYPDVEQMRRLADRSLGAAIRYGVEYTIRYLIDEGRAVHPDTLAVYNDIALSIQKGGHTDEDK